MAIESRNKKIKELRMVLIVLGSVFFHGLHAQSPIYDSVWEVAQAKMRFIDSSATRIKKQKLAMKRHIVRYKFTSPVNRLITCGRKVKIRKTLIKSREWYKIREHVYDSLEKIWEVRTTFRLRVYKVNGEIKLQALEFKDSQSQKRQVYKFANIGGRRWHFIYGRETETKIRYHAQLLNNWR